MDGKNVCEFDVQCRLGAGEEVVELVDLEIGLSVAHVDEVYPDVLQTVDGLGDIAVERLQIKVLAAEQSPCRDLPKDFVNGIEVTAHDVGKAAINYTPVLRLSKSRLNVRPPQPIPCNLEKLFLWFVWKLLAELLEHLLRDVAYAVWYPVQHLLEHREILVRNISEILQVVDEGSSSLLILECHVACYVGIASTLLTGAELLVVRSEEHTSELQS